MFNVQVLIIKKKITGTIRTFIYLFFCQRFASTPEASSGHTKFSHKLHYMEFFEYNDQVKT